MCVLLTDHSVYAGKHFNFLSVKKKSSPDLFKLYGKLGRGDYGRGVIEYENVIAVLRIRMRYIFNTLSERGGLSPLYRESGLKDMYSCEQSFIGALKSMDRSKHQASYKTFKRMRTICKVFKKAEEHRNSQSDFLGTIFH